MKFWVVGAITSCSPQNSDWPWTIRVGLWARPVATSFRRWKPVSGDCEPIASTFISFHHPDPHTPIEETLRALDDVIRQGKVRYIGCSNMPSVQVAGAQQAAKDHGLESFVSCQDEYSLIKRGIEGELFPVIKAHGVGLLPYFPLAGGLLTGKYKEGQAPPPGTRFASTPKFFKYHGSDANFALAERLRDFAVMRGRTLLELAFSWLAARPQVASVIAGATSPEQVEQNASAADWKLTPEEVAQVDHLFARTRPSSSSRQLDDDGADAALGQKADVTPRNRDVRYTPESGHGSEHAGCLLCAINRHHSPSSHGRDRLAFLETRGSGKGTSVAFSAMGGPL